MFQIGVLLLLAGAGLVQGNDVVSHAPAFHLSAILDRGSFSVSLHIYRQGWLPLPF